jgi:hypothetical protein
MARKDDGGSGGSSGFCTRSERQPNPDLGARTDVISDADILAASKT